MTGRLRRFGQSLKENFTNIGHVTVKTLENLDKANEELEKTMKEREMDSVFSNVIKGEYKRTGGKK